MKGQKSKSVLGSVGVKRENGANEYQRALDFQGFPYITKEHQKRATQKLVHIQFSLFIKLHINLNS